MIAEPLRVLLTRVIDYAGLYPPAALRLPEVMRNYEHYLLSPESWMLNRLVLPLGKLCEVSMGNFWRVTLLVDAEPGPLAHHVETLETKGGKRLSLPTYCEAPLDFIQDGYAKVRTATLPPEALAKFLATASSRRIPFKATAGLHHPIRSPEMHGFLNVFVAAIFAWQGMDQAILVQVLKEADIRAFDFRNDDLRWRDWCASTAEIENARRDFAHSFGSCSFEEPVNDLRALGLLT
jgi:hypothetical protein